MIIFSGPKTILKWNQAKMSLPNSWKLTFNQFVNHVESLQEILEDDIDVTFYPEICNEFIKWL